MGKDVVDRLLVVKGEADVVHAPLCGVSRLRVHDLREIDGRQPAGVCIGIFGDGQRELLHVVGALVSPARFASRLHGREQQREQDSDNRDHDEQLNQRETARPAKSRAGWLHRWFHFCPDELWESLATREMFQSDDAPALRCLPALFETCRMQRVAAARCNQCAEAPIWRMSLLSS